MSAIFISYRREDSAAHAGRLYGWFSARFGADRVFMGSGSIALRAGDVAEQLEKRLASCDAMVVVIGRNWLSARHNAGEHRSSDSVDDVELEISLALRRRLLIIPVLVGGANMPSSEDLPPEVRGLAGRNPFSIDDPDAPGSNEKLMALLDNRLEANTPAGKAAREAERNGLRKRLLRRLIWKVPIILLLVSFALWWEWRKQSASETRIATFDKAVQGDWSGEVDYGSEPGYTERFFFQPEGGRLFGTASFRGVKHGIEEGKIEGDGIAFYLRYQEPSGGEQRERKNYYWGRLHGDKILIRMQDDRGSPPVEWTLTRAAMQR